MVNKQYESVRVGVADLRARFGNDFRRQFKWPNALSRHSALRPLPNELQGAHYAVAEQAIDRSGQRTH